ncbi:unnamed protein product [Mytilus edulis]|uniref:Uncharacterized protein n=1 Tax=Mytilus edulis TaxID=6550 RepID=A0A8S3RPN1_MYTED|nr:unnamed protein product [Mytilus edulis]
MERREGLKSVSASTIRKRKQRVKEFIIKENCKNRKRTEREQNKLECEKRQNCLEKKREYQRRKRASSFITTRKPEKIPPFSNKMRKHRAIKKLRQSLPDSPGTRISTLAAYLRNEKSPTIKTLQSSNIIYSPEENNENQLGLAVLEDMKIAISETKLKRTDQARLSMNVLSASKLSELRVKLLNFSNEELKTDDSSENINWECFEYINQNTKHGPKKKLMLVKNTNPGLMVQYLQKLLGTFPAHNFRAKWQNNQLKHLVTNLPQNHVISVHDYSENYKCKERDELQSSYFQKTEASLHVSLLYRHAILEVDGVESTSEDPYIVTENFFVISEDEKHDQYFTFQVQKYISEYLSSISCHVHTMHEFCDGCSCQYKSRHCLGHLRKTLDELGYVNFIRNFFETSHAKGPQDAAGGLIKNQTDLAIVRGRATIQNARDLFEFAKSNLSVPKSSHCKRRLFKYTENINRNFPMFYKPITGIRSVHQVVVNNDHLLIRSLSCYTCNNCLEGNINECENTNILGSFSPVPIVPEIGTVEEDQTDENDMEVPINELISKSTIFAVLCDDDDFDYYLLKAQTETYQLTSRETDSWGVSYQPGTKVIKGNYFMQGENPLHFKMIKRKYGLVPSNSCLYICTDVCVRNGEVKLSEDIHQNILKCVEMSTYVL